MKILLISLTVCLILFSCTNNEINKDKTVKDFGVSELIPNDIPEKELFEEVDIRVVSIELDLISLNKDEYLSNKINCDDYMVYDSSITVKVEQSFSLSVGNKQVTFDCYQDFSECVYYKGFCSGINSYFLSTCNVEVCGSYLLNKNTGIKYYLHTDFDGGIEGLRLSKNKKKLITFSNSFNRESELSYYNQVDNKINFNKIYTYHSDDWYIDDVLWINNDTVLLRVYEKYTEPTTKFKYFKTHIK